MLEKIDYVFRALVFIKKMCFLKIVSFNGFTFNGISFIAKRCSIQFGHSSALHFGTMVSIESNTLIGVRDNSKVYIGDGVFINRNCTIVSHNEIRLSDGVTIGPNCCIYDHDHDIKNRGNFITAPVIIGKNVWIGANTVILKGVTIGDGVVVAAGSIVTKDIPPHCLLIQKHVTEYRTLSYSYS